MELLRAIRSPRDLRALSPSQLARLCAQIRAFLVANVTRTGGHLGSNLGAVELTVAVHRVFDSPKDVLLFDTGHQAYVHKLLTGRQDFSGLRQRGGLSGYPSRAESPHDVIENSHASTALSYADGLAKAFALRDERHRRVVALVGDGALTGGLAWEALNNLAAAPQRPVVIVLNDNGRSYSPTVGAVARHLADLGRRPAPGHNLFAALGLAYIGPVDGHDVAAVEAALGEAVALRRTAVVHCRTRKGRGYAPAEQDLDDHLHAVGMVDAATGRPARPAPPTWTAVFAEELVAIGRRRADVVAVTAAMPGPTGLTAFARAFPDRVHDVGVAEQHAVTSAAGLALGGLHPVVAVYATFLNRAFDQVLMDVALHRHAVTFVLDRAGVTGEDGASHHGVWDLAVLSTVPSLRIAAPRDPSRLREVLREAVGIADGPTVVRFPKAPCGADIPACRRIGGVDVLREETAPDVLLVPVGPMAVPALAAAELLARRGVRASVADPRWVAPVPAPLVALAGAASMVVTVEDGCRGGGFGAAVAQALHDAGVVRPCRALGVPARFLPHARRAEILDGLRLHAAGIAHDIAGWLTDLGRIAA